MKWLKKKEPVKTLWQALDEMKLRHMVEMGDLVKAYQLQAQFEKVVKSPVVVPTVIPAPPEKALGQMTSKELAVYLEKLQQSYNAHVQS